MIYFNTQKISAVSSNYSSHCSSKQNRAFLNEEPDTFTPSTPSAPVAKKNPSFMGIFFRHATDAAEAEKKSTKTENTPQGEKAQTTAQEIYYQSLPSIKY